MGRLRAYFDQLAHPMQDVHSGTITRAYCRAADEAGLRGVLFFPLNRGKSGAAGKGEASVASQFAECLSNYMTHKANLVTLTL